MPLKLFEDLKYSYVDPKEVLKNKARFKSDLGEIRRGVGVINQWIKKLQ